VAVTERGRILPPDLDDRTWRELADEARALIPHYAPQWTDHNPADIGMTLVELFAYLVESLIYRLNRVPEKNYLAFLDLLGIKRDPPQPAKAYLTFWAAPAAPVNVPIGTQAQTQSQNGDEPIVFETDSAVRVLPTNLSAVLHAVKQPGNFQVGTYRNLTGAFAAKGAAGAVLTIPAGSGSTLALGFDQPTTEELAIGFEFTRPVSVAPALVPVLPFGVTLTEDQTAGFHSDGIIRVQPPPSPWTATSPTSWSTIPPATPADAVTGSFYWIDLAIFNLTSAPLELGIRRILFNAVPAQNALTIRAEPVGQSDGRPFQRFALAHGPLHRVRAAAPPYERLQVRVAGTPWRLVEDLSPGGQPEYRVDPVSAEILLGDYDPATRPDGHGAIPPAGAAIEADYRYVAGGASGNVGAGAISMLRAPVTGIIAVTNYGVAEGGADEEEIEETKRRAPEVLRNRNRAVTREDYEYLAREASTEVAIAKCLEPRAHDATTSVFVQGDPWRFGALDRGPGNVSLIIVPRAGVVDERPEPGRDLLQEVQEYLDRRRDLTARLRVVGPRYLPINVNVNAWVWQRAISEGLVASAVDVYNTIRARVKEFLHPVRGGPEGHGWAVGQNVFISDLYRYVMPDERLGYIESLTIAPGIPAYHFPPLGPGGTWSNTERPITLTAAAAWVRVADYELACWGQTTLPTAPQIQYS
jgi:hypothetical protein